MTFFPLHDYWWLYASFIGLIAIVMTIDLGIFNKTPHQPKFKEALVWTIVWVALAALFNIGIYYYSIYKFSTSPGLLPEGMTPESLASKLSLEFLAGYVVEKTLAIDNIFVFAMVFSFFKVPERFQHKILFWGIIGALIFRGIFIGLGSYLMQYHYVVILFGVLLMFTGIKMVFQKEEGDPEDKWILKVIKKFFPVTQNDGNGSFLITKDKKKFVTPLFLALVVIEFSDIIFAVDSVPAIFSLTNEPFIVFTSNIMAILGLRSMYFMISGVLYKFEYIKYGLALVLVFVGMKMSFLNLLFDGKFPITWSLFIIFTIITSSVLYSIVRTNRPRKVHET